MAVAQPFLTQEMHPTIIIGAYRKAMDDMLDFMKDNFR